MVFCQTISCSTFIITSVRFSCQFIDVVWLFCSACFFSLYFISVFTCISIWLKLLLIKNSLMNKMRWKRSKKKLHNYSLNAFAQCSDCLLEFHLWFAFFFTFAAAVCVSFFLITFDIGIKCVFFPVFLSRSLTEQFFVVFLHFAVWTHAQHFCWDKILFSWILCASNARLHIDCFA